MAFDLWTHQFCLSCDKQTDGAVYCSESCRLAEFEKSSPQEGHSRQSASPFTLAPRQPSSKFYLSPAYDFSNAQPYGATPPASGMLLRGADFSSPQESRLTTSSSHSSLCSLQSSTSSNADSSILSDKARKELRAYAVSFDQVRLQRRRSY